MLLVRGWCKALSSHLHSLTPSFCNTAINGHHLVKADCSKFSPTNAVKNSQLVFISDRDKLSKTILPATKRTHCD